jgi:hypothetical protein
MVFIKEISLLTNFYLLTTNLLRQVYPPPGGFFIALERRESGFHPSIQAKTSLLNAPFMRHCYLEKSKRDKSLKKF